MTSVLVVEENVSARTMLSGMLRDRGFTVTEATNSDAALAALIQKSFDIMLSELRLGEEDGIGLLQDAARVAPATRPILMGAFATARDYQSATSLGAITVLSKPFTPEELFEAIQQAIDCETGFRGNFHGLSLTDMLQMFHYARRSVAIVVGGGARGRILLDEGEVIHAEAPGQAGEEALLTLLSASAGSIATLALPEKVERTIFQPLQGLLLGLVTRIDETARDGAGLAGRPRAGAAGMDQPSSTEAKFERRDIMATEKELQDMLGRIHDDIGGFIAASVVDLESGMTLAVHSVRNDFDLAAASAYNTEMVKQKLKIVKALNLKSTLEDMLLTLSDQIHLIKIITPATFLYLAADKSSTNLAIVRSSVNRQIAAMK
jgi:CheY-like chemotaxis protein